MRSIKQIEELAAAEEQIVIDTSGSALPIAWAIPFIVENRGAIYLGLESYGMNGSTEEFNRMIKEIINGTIQD